VKLTESERAENKKALEDMSLPQKLDYIFDYYKFPLVLILIAAVALGSVLYYRLTRREAMLYVAYVNIAVGDTLDGELGEGFTRSLGESPSKKGIQLYRGLYLSRDASVQNHEYAYASQLKLMAAMANKQLDVLLMNREAYDYMSSGGYLMPLDTLVGQAPELSKRLVGAFTTNTVILEDNDIEHRLDESVPYRAITEEAVNGLLISAFERFDRAGFSGDVYLGVVGNSERTDAALKYIDYLTDTPQQA